MTMPLRVVCSIIPVFCVSIVAVTGGAAGEAAADGGWTRFRGPNGSGVSNARGVPTSWTKDDFKWKTPLPGVGHGSPVVQGGRVYVLAEEDDGAARIVLCLHAKDARILWERRFDAATHRKHRRNSFASSTPALDAEHVYVAWATPEEGVTLTALNHAGRTCWQAHFGGFAGGHGFAVSPIVYRDIVVLPNDNDGESSLMAVDRRTGKLRWRIPRRSERITYSTPCVYQRPDNDKEELIFTNWRHRITAVDPATGRVSWERSVFDQSHKERAIGSPVVAGELVIGTCGFVTAQKHVVAVRITREGRPEEVYRIERAVPHVPTVLVHDGRLYLWSDKGIVTCCEAATGDPIWRHRVGGNYFGSPVCVNDHIYGVSDQGVVVVLAAGGSFRELARNELGEACQSTPAVAGGTMYIRTRSHLLAIGGE